MRYRKPWTKDNTEYLIQNYSHSSNDELAKNLNLTREQISSKGTQLNLKKTTEIKRKIYSDSNSRAIKCKHTNEEIKNLLIKYRDYNVVANMVNLTSEILYDWNHRRFKIKMSIWTEEKINNLKLLFSKTSDKDLSLILGIPIRRLQAKARRLDLKKDPDYILSVYEKVSENIKKGPHRFQYPKGTLPPQFKIKFGHEHPNWKTDRSLMRVDEFVELTQKLFLQMKTNVQPQEVPNET